MRDTSLIGTLLIAAMYGAQPGLAGAQQADTSQGAPPAAGGKDTQAKGKAPAQTPAPSASANTHAQGKAPAAQTQPAATAKPTQPPVRVDVDELATDPGQYTGKNVRVQGDIEEFVSPRAFTLDEDSFTATTDVLVVLPRASVVLSDDADVVVQGVVHRLTRAELERDYSFLEAEPDWIVRFEQRPVIIASALQDKKGKDLLVGAKANEGGKTQSPSIRTSVKPGEIARAPEKYYGKQLAVKGEIEDVFGGHVFTLDEDAVFAGPDVMVIMRQPSAAVVDGAEVRVTGTLRNFVWTEMRRDYGFLGLNNDLVARFENRPVLIADAVSRTSSD